VDAATETHLVEDGSADWLDAVLCAVAAAWAARQPNYGLPPDMDRVEGWTAGAAFDGGPGLITARR
jgi:hypothetical protein